MTPLNLGKISIFVINWGCNCRIVVKIHEVRKLQTRMSWDAR